MAAIGTTFPTILDQIKRTDPDRKIAPIVEALSQSNPILQDAMSMEGNLATGHRVTIRAGLPTVAWRKYNQGVSSSKSTTIQVDETTGELAGRSVVDEKLAKLNGNEAAFRLSEDQAFLQSMNNEIASSLIYANTDTAPEEILGFMPRYSDTSADNGANVISAYASASSADQASMLFVTWGPNSAYTIFPRGSKAGLEMRDLGLDYVDDGNGAEFLAYRTHFSWDIGLVVKDWRHHARVCNIDQSLLLAEESASFTTLIKQAMIKAYHRTSKGRASGGRQVIYAPKSVLTYLDLQTQAQGNLWLTSGEWHGMPCTFFRGIPILELDAMDITESVVS